MSNYSLKKDGSFIIKDYNLASPFSNFLPGISGAWGVPLWVFYVNRGQAITSFGIKDKDHSICEFFPANKAYALTPAFGFRTFIKINNKEYYEPFQINSCFKKKEEMEIKSGSLEIRESAPELGLKIRVKYFTLPNTPVGGLVRKVSIKNTSKSKVSPEVLDGLSRIIPFGSINPFLKDMSRTLEAWMRSGVENNLAVFSLIVDPRDVSRTEYIEGANFNFSFYEDKGKKIYPYMIVDPLAVFGQDTSYSIPRNFFSKNFKVPLSQVTCGKTPCSFSRFKWSLAAGEEKSFYSVFGSAFDRKIIGKFIKPVNAAFLEEKEKENKEIVEGLKSNAFCRSASDKFNHYIGSTYLDNVLRGGLPFKPAGEKNREPYYIYSRKHGDPERDYNNFQLLPSCFSEGEANYRDINQNRRMDLFFEPALKNKNVVYFFNLLKIDGYNPLTVKGEKLYFDKEEAEEILNRFNIKSQRQASLMVKGFYLGEFFEHLPLAALSSKNKREELTAALLEKARRRPQASFGEGHWIDHWHYNLDLIESFLYFYPEKAKELFLNEEFTFWDDERRVKARKFRYVLKGKKVYQGESVETSKEKKAALRQREEPKNVLRVKSGKVYQTNLVSKLLTLLLNKSASLDPEGIGVEMEADKPGWCDSLNGLPALLGSSLCETFELKRTAEILLKAVEMLKEEGAGVKAASEISWFMKELEGLLSDFLSSKDKGRDYSWWDKANLLKEEFRAKTFNCLEGKEVEIPLESLKSFLKNLIIKFDLGINKAKDKKSGLHTAYFTYEVKKYDTGGDKCIFPLEFKPSPVALSLEGVVHSLKAEGKKSIHDNLRKSSLFDKKLKMYRLNASLSKEPLEIGRSRVFVPGWLENESIWLHMEYKYLLELLKNGFYEEFFKDFHNCGVCFFNPEKYGRNILENSSFIVSSAYPDKNLWGRGFVARLSGATAELLNMWIFLCLGKRPFFIDKKKQLCLSFSPILKKELFTKVKETVLFEGRKEVLPKNTFSFKFFSKTLVVYHNPKRKDTFGKDCRVVRAEIFRNGGKTDVFSAVVKEPLSLAIRNKEAERIDVYLK